VLAEPETEGLQKSADPLFSRRGSVKIQDVAGDLSYLTQRPATTSLSLANWLVPFTNHARVLPEDAFARVISQLRFSGSSGHRNLDFGQFLAEFEFWPGLLTGRRRPLEYVTRLAALLPSGVPVAQFDL
jgi:hypothetical protein